MKKASLQLDGYYVTELSFRVRSVDRDEISLKAVANLQPKLESPIPESPLSIDVSVNFGLRDDSPAQLRADLTVRSNLPTDSSYPYEFNTRVVGFFTARFADPRGKNQRFFRVNALSILYSVAREIVSSSSSRGPFPGVLLPTVSFVDSPLLGLAERAPTDGDETLPSKKVRAGDARVKGTPTRKRKSGGSSRTK
jgi:preprotein translocase subunit SecB